MTSGICIYKVWRGGCSTILGTYKAQGIRKTQENCQNTNENKREETIDKEENN